MSPHAGKQWLQSIKDTGPGRVERGSSRWVAGLAIIAAGGVLVVSPLLPWAHDTRSGSVISVSGLGAISVNAEEGVASLIKEFNNYGIPGIWAVLVGLIAIVAGAAFLWTRWRSQTALTVAILGGIGFLACMADAINVGAVMGNPASGAGEYAIGFGLLLACAVTLVLVGLGITAFVLERISIGSRSPG